MKTAEHSETIAGSPQQCMEALLDFESYPDWQRAVSECEVLERSATGATVAFVVAVVIPIHYTLRYEVESPGLLSWHSVAGDLKSVEGDYTLEDLGDGTTRATYRLAIDPGRVVPSLIVDRLTRTAMRRSVRELKQRVEDGTVS